MELVMHISADDESGTPVQKSATAVKSDRDIVDKYIVNLFRQLAVRGVW